MSDFKVKRRKPGDAPVFPAGSAKPTKGKAPTKEATAKGEWIKAAFLRPDDVIIRHTATYRELMGRIVKVKKPKNKILMKVWVEDRDDPFLLLHNDAFLVGKREDIPPRKTLPASWRKPGA